MPRGPPLLSSVHHLPPRPSRERYHTLAIFSGLTLVNAFLWITFAPIAQLSQSYYGVSISGINMMSGVFMVLYGPGSILASYMLHRWGLRGALVAGACLQGVAGVARYMSTLVSLDMQGLKFGLVMAGQALAALAQPVFTNVPPKLAGDWFPPAERETATVVGALFNVLGNAIGQVLPTLIVTCSRAHGCSDSSDAHEVRGMPVLLALQAGLAAGTAIWCVALLKEEPSAPPSASAMARRSTREMLLAADGRVAQRSPWRVMYEHTRTLLGDREFLKLVVGFGFGLGLMNALLTELEQLISPLYCTDTGGNRDCDIGASTSDAGLFGGVLIGGGILGAVFIGVLLDRTHWYRACLKGGNLWALVTVGVVLWQLQPGHTGALTACFGVSGFALIPLLPVTFECAVECTYPVPEEASAGLLMLAGNLVGLAATYVLQTLIGMAPVYDAGDGVPPAHIFIAAMLAFAVSVVLSFNGDYKRLRLDLPPSPADPLDAGGLAKQQLLDAATPSPGAGSAATSTTPT